MPDGSVQKVQVILNAQGLEPGTGCGVQLGTLSAVAHVDFIHILHQIQRLLFPDIFVEGAAKVVGKIVFSVRESAGTAKAAHDAAAFAANAAFDFLSVNGTVAFIQGMACFKDSHFQRRRPLGQFVCRENTARTCANNDDIIPHVQNLQKRIADHGKKS